jgi:hypothetical protein
MKSSITRKSNLPEIACPTCGDTLRPLPGEAIAPKTWHDCLRRCSGCELGLSNARTNPTVLFGDPRMNVPQEVRGGVLEILDRSLNERNRANKKIKFGYSTSEDALTWVVFKYLHDSGQLLKVLRRAGLPILDGDYRPHSLLLWGVPLPLNRTDNGRGWRIREQLETISDRLGENPISRTEPDVLLDLGESGIFIIEVKHRSPTDVKAAEYGGWERYYPPESPFPYAADMRASCCYELARNWRFGIELAAVSPRPFTLACLGPDGLFLGTGADDLRPFENCLPSEGSARFQKLGWNRLLGAIEEAPDWLVRYVEARGYTISAEGR